MTAKPENPPAFPLMQELKSLRSLVDEMQVVTHRARIYDGATAYASWGMALDQAIAMLSERTKP